jgi:hypothetical protein
MREIAPGWFHWSATHPVHGHTTHSSFVEPAGIVLDPQLGDAGLDVLDGRVPEKVVLTNRHHYRSSADFVEAFGVPVLVCEAGLHEVQGRPGVATFAWGDEIAPGVKAIEIGAICPDESALLIAHGDGALACADGVVRHDGELGFVSDDLIGEDPAAVKAGLRTRYLEVCEQHEFELLLLAHGEPSARGGRDELRAFATGSL